ncbi:MAG TPA: RagB/SusD family nutrient uptake outer membrane protein, partial [Ohtaekwangia sp.]
PNNNNKRVSVTQGLYDAFEPTDNRRAQWVGSFTNGTTTWYFPHKYKVAAATAVTEYEMMLRLAEQYLIRAEARAQLENISGAQEDLNAIRSRAGLAGTDADDKAALLLAIEQERKAELFAECGHRWLDLKRTGRADAILDPLKTDWQSADALFPIPDAERELNPNLTQNDGY